MRVARCSSRCWESAEALPNLLLPLRLTSSGSLSPLTNSVDHGVERIARLPDRVGEFLDDLIRASLTILEIVHTMATLTALTRCLRVPKTAPLSPALAPLTSENSALDLLPELRYEFFGRACTCCNGLLVSGSRSTVLAKIRWATLAEPLPHIGDPVTDRMNRSIL